MKKYPSNQERTDEYLKLFDREKTLKKIVSDYDPIIFDVGANNGRSLNEFKVWWPKSEVHCFEPQEECWEDLESSASRHNQTYINKSAISVNESVINFYSHDISTGLGGCNKINIDSTDSIYLNQLKGQGNEVISAYTSTINKPRTVPSLRIDSYMDKNGLMYVDLLKIDTQGHEPEVLESIGEKLKNVRVVITELMFYDYYERSLSFSDIERILLPSGFKLYDISHITKNPMNGRTDWIDVIYLNKNFNKNT